MSEACTCDPFWEDRGGGYTELMAEWNPSCPVHGETVSTYRCVVCDETMPLSDRERVEAHLDHLDQAYPDGAGRP